MKGKVDVGIYVMVGRECPWVSVGCNVGVLIDV